MDAVWKDNGKAKFLAVSFIPIVAIIHELLQLVGIAKGTFDTADIFCYSLPLIIYFTIKTFIHN